MAMNFGESLFELYGCERVAMIHDGENKLRVVFRHGDKLHSLRLNERPFSNYPLQWVRHKGRNRLLGYQANVQYFTDTGEYLSWLTQQ